MTTCPHVLRRKDVPFLMCMIQTKQKTDVPKREAIKYICGYQYECPLTHRQENTSGCVACGLRKETER